MLYKVILFLYLVMNMWRLLIDDAYLYEWVEGFHD